HRQSNAQSRGQPSRKARLRGRFDRGLLSRSPWGDLLAFLINIIPRKRSGRRQVCVLPCQVLRGLSYAVPGPLWNGAVSAFRETLRLDAEGVVKTSAIILPGDGGGQLDQLSFAEVPAKLREELIGDVDRCCSHQGGVFNHHFFER